MDLSSFCSLLQHQNRAQCEKCSTQSAWPVLRTVQKHGACMHTRLHPQARIHALTDSKLAGERQRKKARDVVCCCWCLYWLFAAGVLVPPIRQRSLKHNVSIPIRQRICMRLVQGRHHGHVLEPMPAVLRSPNGSTQQCMHSCKLPVHLRVNMTDPCRNTNHYRPPGGETHGMAAISSSVEQYLQIVKT
jgi:hypothetical protein